MREESSKFQIFFLRSVEKCNPKAVNFVLLIVIIFTITTKKKLIWAADWQGYGKSHGQVDHINRISHFRKNTHVHTSKAAASPIHPCWSIHNVLQLFLANSLGTGWRWP